MSGYIKKCADNVLINHIRYQNRYGLTIAGDLYYLKTLDKNQKHAAIIIGAPYGGVKEQGPCVYANELSQRGYVCLTFDPCYMGESSGEPRRVSSPDLFSENFSAGVDYLGMLDFVDKDKIYALGICGSGGFAISAAQVDTRIKKVITASMYDMSYASRVGLTKEQIQQEKEKLSLQRWIDAKNGYPEYIPSFPEKPIEQIDPSIQGIWREFWEFYATKRGHHPLARGGFTSTSNLSFMNYELTHYVDEISPRPILFIVGEQAESRFFSDYVYQKALEPKQMLIVPNCNHVDLYDDINKIPFYAIDDFLKS